MLKPFLSIFEKFKNFTTATLTPKHNTVWGGRGAPWGGPWGSQIFTKTQKCLSAPLETVRSHFHKSYVTNNASALFIRQPKNQSTLTFDIKVKVTTWIGH